MRILLSSWMLLLGVELGVAEEPEFNGRGVNAWLTDLKEAKVPRLRRGAAVALGQIVGDEVDAETRMKVLRALSRSLRTDGNAPVREQAALVIAQQDLTEAEELVNDLAEAMRTEKEPRVARQIALALGRFGSEAKGAIAPLTKALANEDASVRAAAADALGRIGSTVTKATDPLLKLLDDKEQTVRQSAIFALGRVEHDAPKEVAKALAERLLKETDALQSEIVLSLRFLGENDDFVVMPLAKLLKDDDEKLRITVAESLGAFGLGVKPIRPTIETAITDDKSLEVRLNCIASLCKAYGSQVQELIPFLVKRLQTDPNFEVRAAIARELGAMGQAGKAALPGLNQARRDPQLKVREAATEAIAQIEQAGKPKPPRE